MSDLVEAPNEPVVDVEVTGPETELVGSAASVVMELLEFLAVAATLGAHQVVLVSPVSQT